MTRERVFMAFMVAFTGLFAIATPAFLYVGDGAFAVVSGFVAACGGALIARARKQQRMMEPVDEEE